MENVVSRIRKRRHELNLTQTGLAKAANITPAAISQFESGARKPSFATVPSLAEALKVTTDYLFGKPRSRYDDLLADPKVSAMLRGITELPEKDKETMFEFFQFLHQKNTSNNPRGNENKQN